MIVALGREGAVRAEAIGQNAGPRADDALDEPLEGVTADIRHALKAGPAHAAMIFDLDCHGHDGFFLRVPAPNARFFAAYVGLVNLHDPIQLIPGRVDHGTAKFVEPGPSCLITAKAQHPFQVRGIGPVLVANNLPRRDEPVPQWLPGTLEDGPCGHRGAPSTLLAIETPVALPRAARGATKRAHETLGPAKTLQVPATSRLVREELVKLRKVGGVLHDRSVPAPEADGSFRWAESSRNPHQTGTNYKPPLLCFVPAGLDLDFHQLEGEATATPMVGALVRAPDG